MLNQRSQDRLKGVNAELVRCITKSVEKADKLGMNVQISEGLRTLERQKELVAKGASKTMKSRHIIGQAVDVLIYKADNKSLDWDIKTFSKFNQIVQETAKEMGIKITWGGSWTKFVDGPHFQIELS